MWCTNPTFRLTSQQCYLKSLLSARCVWCVCVCIGYALHFYSKGITQNTSTHSTIEESQQFQQQPIYPTKRHHHKTVHRITLLRIHEEDNNDKICAYICVCINRNTYPYVHMHSARALSGMAHKCGASV